jgi:NADH-quinone oxidoreductase subunit N
MNGFNVAEFNAGLHYATPEIFLGLAACAILLLDLVLDDSRRSWTGVLATVALLVTAVLSAVQPVGHRVVALGGLFELDRMAQVLKVVTLITTAVVFVYSTDYLKRRAILKGEYYVLGLFATLGAMALISAANLITLYLGLELMSLCLYAMVAFDRDSGIAAESAIKYFVLGSMASGTLLYGMSIVYGVTGHLDLASIALVVRSSYAANIGLLFGIAFIIVGVGFKLGAVPFHMWIPDVYEGSPTCVTVFIGTASKLAAFALAMRLLPEALGASQPDWSQMLVVLAVLSMVIGTVVAIAQTNLKRMLAYSTISHIGYILLGILAGTPQGYQAAMFYMISYVIVASGAFGLILLQGIERTQPLVRRHDGHPHVQSGGSASLHRLLGQIGCGAGGPRRELYVAGGGRRAVLGGGGVLLSPCGQAHVFRRSHRQYADRRLGADAHRAQSERARGLRIGGGAGQLDCAVPARAAVERIRGYRGIKHCAHTLKTRILPG